MIKINDKLNKKFRQQKDGVCEQDEELRLRMVAQSYAICENSIAVLSNLRTDTSHIYFGRAGEVLGFASADTYQKVDSVCEEEIYTLARPLPSGIDLLPYSICFPFQGQLFVASRKHHAHEGRQGEIPSDIAPHLLLHRMQQARHLLFAMPLQPDP